MNFSVETCDVSSLVPRRILWLGEETIFCRRVRRGAEAKAILGDGGLVLQVREGASGHTFCWRVQHVCRFWVFSHRRHVGGFTPTCYVSLHDAELHAKKALIRIARKARGNCAARWDRSLWYRNMCASTSKIRWSSGESAVRSRAIDVSNTNTEGVP